MRKQFYNKILAEYASYKSAVLRGSSADIYARSYEIDVMTNLSEILLRLADTLSDRDLAVLMFRPNLLRELYNNWLKTDDSIYSELENHIMNEVKLMRRHTGGAHYVPNSEVWA